MHNPDNNDDADWKSAAMAHDSLVVEILLSLKHSTNRPCHGKLVALTGWGAKQLRSGSRSITVTVSGSKSVSDCRRIGRRSRRCSPSTPLSWSGGSGGVMDGCDASSLLHNQWPRSRSKQSSCAVTEVNGATSSKNRKKKTYAELKVEEDMLLKERMHLNQELSMLGSIVKEHRAENETLKRIKVNFITQSTKDNSSNASGTSVPNAASSKEAAMKIEELNRVSLALLPDRLTPSSTSCHAESDVITGQKRSNLILLPDLNMMPSELESAN